MTRVSPDGSWLIMRRAVLQVNGRGDSVACLMDLTISSDLDPQHVPESVFVNEATQRGLRFYRAYHWETVGRELVLLDGVEMLSQHINVHGQGEETFLFDSSLVYFMLRGDDAFLRVATSSSEAHAILETIMKTAYVPVEPATDRREVDLLFWRAGAHGAVASPRTLEVDCWANISLNYSGETRARLQSLVDLNDPPPGGRLVLWYGDPGTGKTRALQALAWEWRDWARFHYITDPEKLFGDADYTMDVALFRDLIHEEKWRVLVLEDTGELLTPDAKVQTGQGLSRLLNLTDGLLGRLTKLLLLVTKNEEVGALHPAVARPGRCAARIEFVPFTAPEARAWLARHGRDTNGSSPKYLADLYAAIESRDHDEWRKVVGFGATS